MSGRDSQPTAQANEDEVCQYGTPKGTYCLACERDAAFALAEEFRRQNDLLRAALKKIANAHVHDWIWFKERARKALETADMSPVPALNDLTEAK